MPATIQIAELTQKSEVDNYIALYSLDTSLLGGGVFYFTNDVKVGGTGPIEFNGITYSPVDFETEGWEWNGTGKMPTPKIRVGNTNLYLTALLQQFDDLLGTIFTRTRTFERYLDDGSDPDPNMHFPIDVYRVDRKSTENKHFIELELATPIEQANRKLPGRQILRDVCTHRYRYYDPDTSSFSYTYATCPYVGSSYFDSLGQSTLSASNDKCGKRPTDCKKRFINAPLPFRGFPGVARVRLT